MTARTENVFVGLGSNLGDSVQILLKTWKVIGEQEHISTVDLSRPFISSPVDMSSHHWFTNCVGRLTCDCSPRALLEILLEIEKQLGRVRRSDQKGYQDRMIDIDIVYFGSIVMDDPRLTLPHPRRLERLFVLAPLALIAPKFIDPESGKTIAELHKELERKLANREMASQEISAIEWPADSV